MAKLQIGKWLEQREEREERAEEKVSSKFSRRTQEQSIVLWKESHLSVRLL